MAAASRGRGTRGVFPSSKVTIGVAAVTGSHSLYRAITPEYKMAPFLPTRKLCAYILL